MSRRLAGLSIFEQLYKVGPTRGQLSFAGLLMAVADPLIDESPPSLAEVRKAMAKLVGGKAPDSCIISAELLKTIGETMNRALHAVVTAVAVQYHSS